jgi:hypothetical protein
MYDWFVQDVAWFQQTQWLLYENGSSGHELGPHVGYLPLTLAQQPTASMLNLGYLTSNGLSLSLQYAVIGGAVGEVSSIVNSSLSLSNTFTTSISLQLFFRGISEINNTPQNDTLVIDANSRTLATDGSLFVATEILGNSPDHVQVGSEPIDFFGTPPLLSDFQGPLGPGDGIIHDYAYQWNVELAPGEVFTVGMHQYIGVVPEPSTLGLLGLALAALAWGRGRRCR